MTGSPSPTPADAGDGGGTIELRLAARTPFASEALADFLIAHAVPGLESRCDDATLDFARILDLPHGHAVARLRFEPDGVDVRVSLADPRDRPEAESRLRRLLDLDADAPAIDAHLGVDPVLGESVAAEPGLRVPGAVDPYETAVRTVVGQQISLAGAATVLGRLVTEHGAPVDLPGAADLGLSHAFPRPDVLAALDPDTLPMPRSRARTVVELAGAVATGEVALDPVPTGSEARIDADAHRAATRAALLARRGIGPWTADYVLMRGLGDPDVLLGTDLVMRRLLQRRGLESAQTERWAPWRSYAGMHLWRLAVGRLAR